MSYIIKNNDVCIIYKLINKVNNKFYIGQTWQSLKDRWLCGHGYNACIHLNNAIKKYGKDNFYYEILATCNTQEQANDLEIYYIEKLDARNLKIAYNIREGGSKGKLAEESKRKVSQSLMGHTVSEETRDKLSKRMLGNVPWNKGTIGIMKTNSGSFKPGERISIATEFKKKLTIEQENYIWLALQSKTKLQKELAIEFNVSQSSISRIKFYRNKLGQ